MSVFISDNYIEHILIKLCVQFFLPKSPLSHLNVDLYIIEDSEWSLTRA